MRRRLKQCFSLGNRGQISPGTPAAARTPGPMRTSHGIEPLPLEEEAVLMLPRLSELHRDPFDRMLICQALTHQLVLLTPDAMIRQYPVRVLW